MGALERLLDRYGAAVELERGGETRPARAFLQPVADLREGWLQGLPTPLGRVGRERFLYIGPPEEALEDAGGRLRCRGVWYEVTQAQAVYVGQRRSHWRAVLRREEET